MSPQTDVIFLPEMSLADFFREDMEQHEADINDMEEVFIYNQEYMQVIADEDEKLPAKYSGQIVPENLLANTLLDGDSGLGGDGS